MFSWIVLLCFSIIIVKDHALPTVENYLQQSRTLNLKQCKSCTQFEDLMKQTKEFGLLALDHITEAALNLGSTVLDMASDIYSIGLDPFRDILSTSQEMFAIRFKDVKRFGKEGIKFFEEILSATGDFLIDSLSKLPMVKQQHSNKEDAQCSESDQMRSLVEFFDL